MMNLLDFGARQKRWLLRLAVVLTFCTLVSRSAHADDTVSGYVVVRLLAGVNIQALAADYKTTALDQTPGTTLYTLATPRGVSDSQFVSQLSTDKRVQYAEPDRIIASAEISGAPFHLSFDRTKAAATYVNSVSYTQVHLGQTDALNQINGSAPLATGQGVVVAVLDTGVTYTHPDLLGHLLPGYNAIMPDTLPWDIADGSNNNELGHGTMVSGIIARVAPRAAILPVRVLNADGVGTIFSLVKGIHYANTHGARVLNMSFGCSIQSGALNDALDESEQMGVLIVAAVGNNNSTQILPPATGHGCLAVGSVEADNTKSPYSNYGSSVRVVAPGTNIRSTFVDGGYATWSGTSFSTPFVSAEAALMFSTSSAVTVAQVKDGIRATAVSVDKVNPKIYQGQLGKGIIDIEAAVKSLLR